MTQRLGSRGRVWILNAAIAGLALWLYIAYTQGVEAFHAGTTIPWPALAAVFYLTEIFVVNVDFRTESESFSLNEIPLVIGLFFVAPDRLVLAQVAGALVALAVARRQPLVKLSFNVAQLAVGALVASMIFRAIAVPSGTLGGREALAAFLATAATIFAGVLAVVAAISLAEGGLKRGMFWRVLSLGGIGTVTNTSLALTGVLIARAQAEAAWLLLVPAGTLFVAYRAYTSQRRQHESLQQLYEATRLLQRSISVEPTMRALLDHARVMFRAGVAAVTFFPKGAGGPALETTLGPGDDLAGLHPIELDPTEGVWARVAAEGQGILLARPIANERLREFFAAREMRDAMIAPLRGDAGVIGIMVLGNRLGDVDTFTHGDLTLFETLVNHASVSLENARLVAELQAALSRQTELGMLKDEFLAVVSHELRTPLTSIQGFVSLLLNTSRHDRDEQLQCLQVIERQGKRLHALIEDLLLTTQLESKAHRRVTMTRLALQDVVAKVIEGFSTPTRRHAFSVRVGDALPEVASDADCLHRIMSNLIANAIKYSPPDTSITIGARAEDGGLVLSVTDEGVGIPDELHQRIFDRFYQGNGGSHGGVGLGLYICRRLAEEIGGRLWVERSAPGEGSTFSLWLPAAPPRGVRKVTLEDQDERKVVSIARAKSAI